MVLETRTLKRVCVTYNGMGREAIYWGVPIIPFAIVAIISLILVAIAVYSVGVWGVLALMPGAMLLVAEMVFVIFHLYKKGGTDTVQS